jgi:hypothetical protein
MTASYTITGATDPRLLANSATVSTLASATATFSVSLGTVTLSLNDGATVLKTRDEGIGCTAGTAVTSGVCQPTTYTYTRLDLAIVNSNFNSIYWINEAANTVNQLVNKTSYQTGATPLQNCALADTLDTDGAVVAQCVTRYSTPVATRLFKINPLTKEIFDFTGTLPSGATLRNVAYGTYGDTPYTAHDIQRKGAYIDYGGGKVIYFTASDPSANLRKTSDNFTTSSVISTETFNLLMTFSNP